MRIPRKQDNQFNDRSYTLFKEIKQSAQTKLYVLHRKKTISSKEAERTPQKQNSQFKRSYTYPIETMKAIQTMLNVRSTETVQSIKAKLCAQHGNDSIIN